MYKNWKIHFHIASKLENTYSIVAKLENSLFEKKINQAQSSKNRFPIQKTYLCRS